MVKRKQDRRWRVFADVAIQGWLLTRLAAYWVLFLTIQVGTAALLSFVAANPDNGPTAFMTQQIVASLLVLPIAMYDLLKFSNRFVGPVVNLRQHLRQIQAGHPVEELAFRKEDFYWEIPAAINQLRTQVAGAEPECHDSQRGSRIDSMKANGSVATSGVQVLN